MTIQASKTQALSQLYAQDYFCWLNETARLLRSGDLAEIDRENLAEEIEDMGRSEKRSLENNLEIVLMHLLKYQYQPELRSNSWYSTLAVDTFPEICQFTPEETLNRDFLPS